ncbi:hypothetical protein MMC21_005520 [Puttea exsequens]|nr:hypothetical protein [Puttea exsequens]
MAEIGELKYDSEVAYQTVSSTGDSFEHLDVAMLNHLKEAMKGELDCQVCYALMLDPLTTTCGHTFCRKCVARVLDHSTLCPICRRALAMPPAVENVPGNLRLSKLLDGLCPDLVIARRETAAQEEPTIQGEKNVPLFVCTLAYPGIPTFLHIFEPRYRLMIRRAMETGDRKFGMLMYNYKEIPQGDLGITQFMEYGTMLHIDNFQLLPDGRSLIECHGVSTFRVKDWGQVDGYLVGNTQRIDDISIAEEEQIEALETSGSAPAANDLVGQLDHMSTAELLQIGTDFIRRMQDRSAPWLHERILSTYGLPPNDPTTFPFWLASILPFSNDEKYKLLQISSVRERLKITAKWVRRVEAHRWEDALQFLDTPSSSEDEEDDDDETMQVEGPDSAVQPAGAAASSQAARTPDSSQE